MGASGIRETFVVVDARENAQKSRNSDENAGANQFATRRRNTIHMRLDVRAVAHFCIKFACPCKISILESGSAKVSTTTESALLYKGLRHDLPEPRPSDTATAMTWFFIPGAMMLVDPAVLPIRVKLHQLNITVTRSIIRWAVVKPRQNQESRNREYLSLLISAQKLDTSDAGKQHAQHARNLAWHWGYRCECRQCNNDNGKVKTELSRLLLEYLRRLPCPSERCLYYILCRIPYCPYTYEPGNVKSSKLGQLPNPAGSPPILTYSAILGTLFLSSTNNMNQPGPPVMCPLGGVVMVHWVPEQLHCGKIVR